MRKSLLPEKYHLYVYIFALVLLVIGMPLSKFLMSLSQIILACNWLLEGRLKSKFISFSRNKAALVVSSLLLMHFIGLLYTSDFNYAFKDIRIKAPLLVLPLILSTSIPLSRQIINMLMQLFVAAILAGTVISMLILSGIIHREVIDIRSVSIFISHIRFALLICVAVFISGYFLYKGAAIKKLVWTGIAVWLVIFLILTESITGLSALCVALLAVMMYSIFSSQKKITRYAGVLIVVLIGGFLIYAYKQITKESVAAEKFDQTKLATVTSRGNIYDHDLNGRLTENGHYIWINVCFKELKESWNKRSAIDYSEKDLKGNNIEFTLIRFLASKGSKKDADAVESLTNEEVKAIERGVVNVNYQDLSSLDGRLHEIGWELDVYKKSGDPNGHSLTQRFEFWKAAVGIIKENLLIGVGTGDIAKAFELQYDKMNSPLQKEWRLRSHNQYLSIGVAFGILGLIWFLITLFYPMIIMNKQFDYLYVTFLIIAVISFLTEDTLETQAGVTFFAFFNSFFLFVKKASPLTPLTSSVLRTPSPRGEGKRK